MRIGAVVGVKDEVELIDDCVAHLRAIGVDHIVAIDGGSTDGSLERLARHASERFLVRHYDDLDPDLDAWERVHLAAARTGDTDWTLFLDVDEFWIPAAGTLRDVLHATDADVLKVPRFNVPLDAKGPLLGPDGRPGLDTPLICAPIADFRAHMQAHPDTPWIRGVPVPKIAARTARIGGLGNAGHDIVGIGDAPLARRDGVVDVVIAHLPFTTPARFATKVDNIRKVFAAYEDWFRDHPASAWHWRRWLALADDAAVRREFDHQAFDAATLRAMRADGTVRTARELFAAAGAAAPVERA